MKSYIASVAVFISAIILGVVFFVGTFEHQQKRSTASLKNHYDLTCLSGEQLSAAIVNRVVAGFKSVRKEGYLGIHVGHFTYSDSESDKQESCSQNKDRNISSAFSLASKKMACEIYPKINLIFLADGESVGGNKRQMDIEAPCAVSSDLNHTEVTWVPWKQLAMETPFEGVSEYSKPSKVTVKTFNITDKWPDKWILEKIEMEGDAGKISIDAAQIKKVAGRAFVFEFN